MIPSQGIPQSFHVHAILAISACGLGIAVAVWSRHLPMRGWLALGLGGLSGLLWGLMIGTTEHASPPPIALQIIFLAIAPVTVVYSFVSRRLAPDRIAARIAFFSSIVVAVLSVLLLCGSVCSLMVP